MQLAIYNRDESGKVVFHGLHNWPTPGAFIAACYPNLPPHEVPAARLEKLKGGWPDKAVHWAGKWGFAVQVPKPKLRGVNLTDEQVEVARGLGSGNISEGIRVALRVVEQIDDISQYFK